MRKFLIPFTKLITNHGTAMKFASLYCAPYINQALVRSIAISSVQLRWMCLNPFLEMLLARALALLLFYTDITLPETIKIVRFIPEKNWKRSIDEFILPESVCNQTESQSVDCAKLCEHQPDETDGSRHFHGSCSNSRSTLTYTNSQWTCQKNRRVRSKYGELYSLTLI